MYTKQYCIESFILVVNEKKRICVVDRGDISLHSIKLFVVNSVVVTLDHSSFDNQSLAREGFALGKKIAAFGRFRTLLEAMGCNQRVSIVRALDIDQYIMYQDCPLSACLSVFLPVSLTRFSCMSACL